MKNENGTGTVYKLSGKRRKPWVARVTTGYSIDGKQLRKTLGTFQTKREAQEVLFQYNKNPNNFSEVTFGEVKNMWWSEYIKTIKEKTAKNCIFELKKMQDLEKYKIKDINFMFLQKFFTEKNCSPLGKVILNHIFNYACKCDFIEKHKIHLLEVPKPKRKLERKVFTSEEIKLLWERVDKTQGVERETVVFTLILIYTGLRCGELLNLKLSDLDLENQNLTITASKTINGLRKIPLHLRLLPLIYQTVESKQEFLFELKNKKISYVTINKRFEKYITNHTIHDTRHTFATLLNNAEANKSSIIKLVGHSNFKITENVYTHKSLSELRKAVDKID